jgi:O-antigen/teichoic acid export membrane protein
MLIGITITTVDIFMLGIWVNSAEVGLYSAAAQIASTMLLLLVAINTVVAPKFSELHVQNRKRELEAIARSCALFSTALGLPVYLLFLVFPDSIAGLFGAEFRSASLYLIILATGQFINIATGSVSMLLMMTGNERTLQNITAATGLMNIVLNAALIPSWGAAGAAIATAISVACLNIACLFMVYRKLSIRMIPFLPY